MISSSSTVTVSSNESIWWAISCVCSPSFLCFNYFINEPVEFGTGRTNPLLVKRSFKLLLDLIFHLRLIGNLNEFLLFSQSILGLFARSYHRQTVKDNVALLSQSVTSPAFWSLAAPLPNGLWGTYRINHYKKLYWTRISLWTWASRQALSICWLKVR